MCAGTRAGSRTGCDRDNSSRRSRRPVSSPPPRSRPNRSSRRCGTGRWRRAPGARHRPSEPPSRDRGRASSGASPARIPPPRQYWRRADGGSAVGRSARPATRPSRRSRHCRKSADDRPVRTAAAQPSRAVCTGGCASRPGRQSAGILDRWAGRPAARGGRRGCPSSGRLGQSCVRAQGGGVFQTLVRRDRDC